MIDSIQKQIDFYVRETIRLRCTQNSHLAISLLPAELLSDVFLYLVEDGLESGGAHFATGTFSFLQVCRHWNEVAVGSPQLWALWVTGASKAWPLFKSRSKDVPVSLTWRPQHNNLSPDALKDAGTPKRIRQLDFNGTYAQLENLLGPLDSTSVSVTSSIRLRGISGKKNGEHLTRFLSLPFPNLSKVDIEDFLPGPSSSIFITSNLTSLKLDVSYNSGRRYTRSQLLQILQQHPNLRELELKDGAIPSTDKSGTPVPVLLPQLVDLRLYGTEAAIAGFIDFVNMSSPLRNVVIGFQYSYSLLPALTKTIKKVLRAYYECQGLEYPRKANDLTVSSSLLENDLSFDAASPSAPAPRPTSNLQLQFVGMVPAFAGEIVSLFPLKHVHKFAVVRTDLGTEGYRKILQKMKGLSLLRLDGVYFGPVFDALTPNDGGVYRELAEIGFNLHPNSWPDRP